VPLQSLCLFIRHAGRAAGTFPPLPPSYGKTHLKDDIDGQNRIRSSQHAHGYRGAALDIGVLSDRGMLPASTASPPRLFSTGFPCSSIATLAARTSTSALRVSIASPRSTISTKPRLPGSRPTGSSHVLWSRPAPATFKPGSSTQNVSQAPRHLGRADIGGALRR
jgi:hypothetical protein